MKFADPQENPSQDIEKQAQNSTCSLYLVVCALLLNPAEKNHMAPKSLLNRVRSEFIEMPGLRLRIDQAQRLWNMDQAMCESVLRSLVEAKFLRRFENDLYARL
jgi:hypothetical protein